MRPAIAVILSLVISACSSGSADGESVSWEAVRDTLGDTLIVRTLSGSVWGDTANLVPEISVGLVTGPEEYLFASVRSLATAPDGTLYVMDGGIPALRVYNPDGTYRATFGRWGEGPGEYKSPDGGLNVLSDGRVLLRDPGNARIQVYSPEGEPLETWRIRGNYNTSNRMVVDREDRTYTQLLLDPTADIRDWQTGLMRILPDGTVSDTLAAPRAGWDPPRIEARVRRGEGFSVTRNPVPFAPDEHWALSPLGYFIHGVSTEYAFTLHRIGVPPLRVERVYEPVTVAAGERAEREAFATRNMRGMDPNWRWTGPSIPSVKPPYAALFAGEDGTVWVQVHQPGVKGEDPFFDPSVPNAIPNEWREPVLFDVFDQEGRYLGAVRGPNGLRLRPQPIFTREWVLATVRDELDVQSVVRFRVELP
jgi:hypothetical protein